MLIMSLFEKIWKMSPLGDLRHIQVLPFTNTYAWTPSLDVFFSVKLVEICADKEWEFMKKVILKLLGSFQGSELGATRRCRIKTKEARGHGEKNSRNCLLLDILNAWHVCSTEGHAYHLFAMTKVAVLFHCEFPAGEKNPRAACYRIQMEPWKFVVSFSLTSSDGGLIFGLEQ